MIEFSYLRQVFIMGLFIGGLFRFIGIVARVGFSEVVNRGDALLSLGAMGIAFPLGAILLDPRDLRIFVFLASFCVIVGVIMYFLEII